MIKAQELRIGNLINYNGNIGYKIDLQDFRDLYENEGEIDYYSPIPLTEEWLKRFGFEQSQNKQYQFRYLGRLFVKRDNSIYDYGSEVKIEWVHQMQNFIFALCKTELTLNT